MAINETLMVGLDLTQYAQRAKTLLIEIRKGRILLGVGQKILTDRRFQLGQLLGEVRKSFPLSGPGASGWGKFCRELGLKRATAGRYIEIAVQVEARPELADRRSFQQLYEELGLALPPPGERSAAAAAANVTKNPTPDIPRPLRLPPDLVAADVDEVEREADREAEESGSRQGRPPLSEEERRDDIYTVRLNTEETLRLRRLSGLLAFRDAEVFREGLLALEEREAQKAAPFHPRYAGGTVRRAS